MRKDLKLDIATNHVSYWYICLCQWPRLKMMQNLCFLSDYAGILTAVVCKKETVLMYDKHAPKYIKLFSCSTELSTKFQLLIKAKIPKNKEVSCFKALRCCIYHAHKGENANNCWHFNINGQDKFRAQLS